MLAKGKGGNTAHKMAIEEGVRKVHGMSVNVNDVPHAGSTDFAIVRDMVMYGGGSEESALAKMAEVIAVADAAIPRLVEEAGGMSNLVLPGVQRALEALSDAGATLALTTGNLESCAWAKLRAAGLDKFFKEAGGGFGSDAFDRSDILKTAIDRVSSQVDLVKDGNGKYVNAFHIGDSIADMSASAAAGVNGVGVLTGSFTREELEKESPCVVFDDLSDTDAFLNLLGVKPTEKVIDA